MTSTSSNTSTNGPRSARLPLCREQGRRPSCTAGTVLEELSAWAGCAQAPPRRGRGTTVTIVPGPSCIHPLGLVSGPSTARPMSTSQHPAGADTRTTRLRSAAFWSAETRGRATTQGGTVGTRSLDSCSSGLAPGRTTLYRPALLAASRSPSYSCSVRPDNGTNAYNGHRQRDEARPRQISQTGWWPLPRARSTTQCPANRSAASGDATFRCPNMDSPDATTATGPDWKTT